MRIKKINSIDEIGDKGNNSIDVEFSRSYTIIIRTPDNLVE